MVKTDTIIWNYFTKTINARKKFATCSFCKTKYVSHAPRMVKHLLKCKQCPDHVKKIFREKICKEAKSNVNRSQRFKQLENTSSASSSSTLRQFVDTMDVKSETVLHQALARALYYGAIPFSFVENEYFVNFLKLMRPSFKPPSRKVVATSLLDKEYNLVKSAVDEKIQRSDAITILSDGWTDINGIPLINIIAATPAPVFLKTIDSEVERHSSEYIFTVFDQVIEEIGPKKVIGVCTDNAPTMKAAWGLIKNKYPYITTYGCSAHSFNLIAKDLCKLPTFSRMFAIGKQIIQFFKNKHLPRQILKKIQIEQLGKESALMTPVETRWSTVHDSFASLLKNKDSLQAAVFDKQISKIIDPSVKKSIINDEDFWKKVEKCQKILSPLAKAIKIVESDEASSISLVVPALLDVEENVNDNIDDFSVSESTKIIQILKDRKNFLVHDVHLSAYVLNPKLKGEKLSELEKEKALQYILNVGKHLNKVETQILQDYVNYMAKSDLWEKELIWKAAECTNALSWWRGLCSSKIISDVAVYILKFPSSSATCERNWKTHSLIKTKKRNRLTLARTEKLVMVKSNLKLLSLDDLQKNKKTKETITETITNRTTDAAKNSIDMRTNSDDESDSSDTTSDLDSKVEENSYDDDFDVNDDSDDYVEQDQEGELGLETDKYEGVPDPVVSTENAENENTDIEHNGERNETERHEHPSLEKEDPHKNVPVFYLKPGQNFYIVDVDNLDK